MFKCFKKPKGKESFDIPMVLSTVHEFTDLELDVMELVNYHRREKGLRMLTFNFTLGNIATPHAKGMAHHNKLTHSGFPIRNAQAMKYCKATWLGEVVAYGYISAEGFLNGWLNSETHRRVIESERAVSFAISIEANAKYRNYAILLMVDKK